MKIQKFQKKIKEVEEAKKIIKLLIMEYFKTAGQSLDDPIAGVGDAVFGNLPKMSDILIAKNAETVLKKEKDKFIKEGPYKIDKMTDDQISQFLNSNPKLILYGLKYNQDFLNKVNNKFSLVSSSSSDDKNLQKTLIDLKKNPSEKEFYKLIYTIGVTDDKYETAYHQVLAAAAGVPDTKALLKKLITLYKSSPLNTELGIAITSLISITKDIKIIGKGTDTDT